jgi:hypothetical protein
LTPKRFDLESRPFVVLPPAFFDEKRTPNEKGEKRGEKRFHCERYGRRGGAGSGERSESHRALGGVDSPTHQK